MNLDAIITAIDSEIARLQQARALIAAIDSPAVKRRGRPKNTVPSGEGSSAAKTRKPMSAETKARMAAAQKKRWAAAKKSAK